MTICLAKKENATETYAELKNEYLSFKSGTPCGRSQPHGYRQDQGMTLLKTLFYVKEDHL